MNKKRVTLISAMVVLAIIITAAVPMVVESVLRHIP